MTFGITTQTPTEKRFFYCMGSAVLTLPDDLFFLIARIEKILPNLWQVLLFFRSAQIYVVI
jgi:hypothetical protein